MPLNSAGDCPKCKRAGREQNPDMCCDCGVGYCPHCDGGCSTPACSDEEPDGTPPSAAPTASDRDDGAVAAGGNNTGPSPTETASEKDDVRFAFGLVIEFLGGLEKSVQAKVADVSPLTASTALSTINAIREFVSSLDDEAARCGLERVRRAEAEGHALHPVSSAPAASSAQKASDKSVPDPLRGHDAEPRLNKEIELLIGSCEAIAKNARDRSDQRRIGYDGYNASFDSGYASALENMADRLRQIQKKVVSTSLPVSEPSGVQVDAVKENQKDE